MTQIGYGTARAVLPARDSHQRLGGIVAGPMLMGLADLAMYAAVVGATGQAHAVTASFTINFLRKVRPAPSWPMPACSRSAVCRRAKSS